MSLAQVSDAAHRAGVGRRLALVAVAVCALGVCLGIVWWVAAPLARTDVVDGSVYLIGHKELRAAQDGWFAVVTGLAGVLAATVLSLLPSARVAVDAVLGPVLAVLAAIVAWRTGVLLGPPPLLDQARDGVSHPLTPLELHAYAVLLVGPFLFSFTRFLASLFGGDSRR